MGNCYGGSTVPGSYAYGNGAQYAAGYGAVDADPITPGIQSTPGVVTPVGPPQVVGGTGVGATTFGGPGFAPTAAPYPAGGFGATTVGVPPIGTGFQQTTFQTTTSAPPPFVQGGFRPPIVSGPVGPVGPVGGFNTSFPAAGIRPGFGGQVGGPFIPQSNFGAFNRAGIDMDPISPGIQTQPGVVTATGPSFRVWSYKIQPLFFLTCSFTCSSIIASLQI